MKMWFLMKQMSRYMIVLLFKTIVTSEKSLEFHLYYLHGTDYVYMNFIISSINYMIWILIQIFG